MEEVGKTHGALTVTPTVLIAVATFPCQKTQPTLGLTRLYTVSGKCGWGLLQPERAESLFKRS